MKAHHQEHLQLSLLGFTTFTMKLISSGNKSLLKKTLLFINRLFIESSVDVKDSIIENYLYPVYSFLNDCRNKQEIIRMFPFWMQTEYLCTMRRNQQEEQEIVFVLHLN